jgi:hypothetical protein
MAFSGAAFMATSVLPAARRTNDGPVDRWCIQHPVQITRAVGLVAQVGEGSLDQATGEIADEGQRLVAAAEAFQPYDHADGTALLTSFLGLSVACQQAGYKPSWFDAQSLASR